MTAQLFRFPATPDQFPRVRGDIVTAARAILRSPAPHDKETIREACHALMTWGDQWDWAEAYPVLRALDLPPIAKPVTRPPYSQQVGLIRGALLDVAGLAVIVAVALGVYLVGGA